MIKSRSHQAKLGGVPNRGSLYAVAAVYSKEAIYALYDLMMNSKNGNIRLGAIKAILDKSLPELMKKNPNIRLNLRLEKLIDKI